MRSTLTTRAFNYLISSFYKMIFFSLNHIIIYLTVFLDFFHLLWEMIYFYFFETTAIAVYFRYWVVNNGKLGVILTMS